MAFPKYRPAPPPKNKIMLEKRIIDGTMRKVETYNGKVARVYDDDLKLLEDRSKKLKIVLPTPPLEPKVRHKPIQPQENKADIPPDKPIEESPILEVPSFLSTTTKDEKTISEEKISGTEEELISESDIKDDIKPGITTDEQLKLSDEQPKLSNEQPKLSNEQLLYAENIKEEKINTPINDIPKSEPKIENNVETSKIREGTDSGSSLQLDTMTHIQDTRTDQQLGAKKKTSIQRETREMGIPGVPIKTVENRIDRLADNKTHTFITNDKTKVENKAVEITKAENRPIEDKITKENKNMVEELLEEYKREQWAKKRDFEKNIEDMARVASENKGQIKEISQKIEGVTGKVGEVEEKIGGLQENIQDRLGTLQERLGDIKKPVSDTLGELCNGVDCIKTDLKKSQEYQQLADKHIETKFQELSERLQKLEEPTYICDNCGQDNIRPLSSFCPNCGAPIHSWTDPETGMPISGWAPFWKRARGTVVE
jgi:hypothetical protein